MQRLITQAEAGDAAAAAELLTRLRRLGAFEPAVEAVRQYMFEQMSGLFYCDVGGAISFLDTAINVLILIGDKRGATWALMCRDVAADAVEFGEITRDAVMAVWRRWLVAQRVKDDRQRVTPLGSGMPWSQPEPTDPRFWIPLEEETAFGEDITAKRR